MTSSWTAAAGVNVDCVSQDCFIENREVKQNEQTFEQPTRLVPELPMHIDAVRSSSEKPDARHNRSGQP